MKIDKWQIPLLVIIGVLGLGAYWRYPANTSEAVAAWVQAVGSVGAIIGAIWIASEQHRREIERRQSEESKASYLLQAELAWLSSEVVGFLNQFFAVEVGEAAIFIIHADEVSDLLGRLSWCRQRVEHKGQLAMLGTLRRSLIKTVRVIRIKRDTLFIHSEVEDLRQWREEALEVMNASNGLEIPHQYRP